MPETKAKIRIHAEAAKLVGHTFKRRLAYQTKEVLFVHLHSPYEIQVTIEFEAAEVCWTRPQSLAWRDEWELEHRYHPDFIYHCVHPDAKNEFLQQQNEAKFWAIAEQNGNKILVLGR